MFIFSMPFFSRTALRVQRWMMRNTAVGRFRITSAASGSRTAGKGLSAASWKSSSAAIHTEKRAESMGRTRPGQGLGQELMLLALAEARAGCFGEEIFRYTQHGGGDQQIDKQSQGQQSGSDVHV